MRNVVAFFICASLCGSCNKKTSVCSDKESANCVCTTQYDPVCGCNKKHIVIHARPSAME